MCMKFGHLEGGMLATALQIVSTLFPKLLFSSWVLFQASCGTHSRITQQGIVQGFILSKTQTSTVSPTKRHLDSKLSITHPPVKLYSSSSNSASTHTSGKNQDPTSAIEQETDVIVIGSGIAGLSCAALLSYSAVSTVVLESHDTVGGCAHGWKRRGFTFESGPSLYSGLSVDPSPNPLKNIFQIIEEQPEWITYDRWGTVLPDGSKFAAKIGPDEFGEILDRYPGARQEFDSLMKRMAPLSDAAQSLTSLSLREDAGAFITTALRYPRELWQTLQVGSQLNAPFQTIMDEMNVRNEFVINWLDMLCFLLQGLPSAGTMNAVIAYMLADWYRPGVVLDFPKGGSGAIAESLVRGIEKWGALHKTKSRVCVNSHVDEILVEGEGSNARACGVRLRDGTIIKARTAVVSNADPFVTNSLLATFRQDGRMSSEFRSFMDKVTDDDGSKGGIPNLKSFIHLHAGIDASGLPEKPSVDLPAQWAVVKDWNIGVEAPRNIVLCSMPSLLDPTLAPKGKHVLHAYVPATEPYEWWANMDRQSDEYLKKKDAAADFLWSAIEQYVPNARNRIVPGTLQIGTPLTHERFLRRTKGTYGPRVEAGKNVLPGHKTPLRGLYLCGDFTFPGIGIPAAAASGAITANTIISVPKHLHLLNRIRLPG